MADLLITPGNLRLMSSSVTKRYTAGEAVAPGEMVRLDTTTNKVMKATNDSVDNSRIVGLAVTYGDLDGSVEVCTGGSLNPGATLTTGERYYCSNTAGAIAPSADVGLGEYVSLLGIAEGTSSLKMNVWSTGIVHA